MIWVRGAIVADEDLKISALDRTFEHGLGLFETLRTWGGRPTLLDRHLARLRGWAEALGLPFDPGDLPDSEAVRALREAEGAEGDGSLRIVLSGGHDDGRPGTVWMRSRPLPPPIAGGGAAVCSTWFAAEGDGLMRAKTLNYWSRRLAFEEGKRLGFDENLGRDPSGSVLEGSRSNVFLVSGGAIVTPADVPSTPFLAGIMRGAVIERAGGLGIGAAEETGVTIDHIMNSDECFLTNGGRGIVPVSRFEPGGGRGRSFEAPGPVTRRLMDELDAWLRSEDAR